ncbi:hypothetical protein [Bacillus cereus]|uniref:hypothetical protein n=1 Tax=Bacillus cereus TaxID=1396 RepID=UPI000BF7F8DB|nr:hypothetical protein [Bacillus cereus]PFN14857.1 hypothetical protein COJ72_14040 [Bacillus cereus]
MILRWLVKKIMKEQKEFEDIVTNNRFNALEYRISVLQKDLIRLNKNRTEDDNDITIHLNTGEQIKLNVTNEQLNELYNNAQTSKLWIKLSNNSLIRRDDIRFIEGNEKSKEIVYADGILMGFKKK